MDRIAEWFIYIHAAVSNAAITQYIAFRYEQLLNTQSIYSDIQERRIVQVNNNSKRHVHVYLFLKLKYGPSYEPSFEDLSDVWRQLKPTCPNGV